MGSGQTAIAALANGRHFIGYETSRNYVALAKRRIKALTSQEVSSLARKG
jgi:DNA modification methylase